MNNYHNIICKVICLVCLVAWVGGCTDQSTPVEPRVVRKKIVAKKPTQAPRKTAPKTIAQAPAVSRPKSDIARGAPPSLEPKQPVAQKGIDQASTPKGVRPTGPATVLPASRPTASPPKTAIPAASAQNSPLPSTRTAAVKKAPAAGHRGPPPVYNPNGKIDPFIPLFTKKQVLPSVGKRKKKRIPRTPLERVALSQLKLTAIIMAPSGNRAMVQESTGKGYVIQKGTYIGLNSGKVENITKDRVIIVEEAEDSVGKIRTQKRQLVLPKPAGDR
jgi:type IV pilus assembly protein PilP